MFATGLLLWNLRQVTSFSGPQLLSLYRKYEGKNAAWGPFNPLTVLDVLTCRVFAMMEIVFICPVQYGGC